MAKSRIILVDNGSLEPDSTLNLRRIAVEVGLLINQTVHPVSVLHSNKVDVKLIENKPAEIFAEAVKKATAEKVEDFIVLPLFMGPSRAITEFIPEQFKLHAAIGMKLLVADTLYGADGELRKILIDNLKSTQALDSPSVILLCDHGSPAREVAAVRNQLAEEIRNDLQLTSQELIACSMERRDGPEYAFNEPLLETVLSKVSGHITILMQFLLPGRHAGSGGDVAQICQNHAQANTTWKLSPLIGTHPALAHLLASRYRELSIK